MFNIEKEIILPETQYVSGYTPKDDEYVLSASMVGNDYLQNYLTLIYGKEPEDHITDATLGTIFHKGMEELLIKYQNSTIPMWSERSMNMTLPNGWILSGTADLIIETKKQHFEIRDYKLTKNYTRKMLLKNISEHTYTKQLQTLEVLFRQNHPNLIENVNLICDFFMKDSAAIKGEIVYQPTEIPNISVDQTINSLIDITNTLQEYIESGTTPPECDTWPRKIKGKSKIIHTRCKFYCSHGKAGVCPAYEARKGSDIMQIQDKVDW